MMSQNTEIAIFCVCIGLEMLFLVFHDKNKSFLPPNTPFTIQRAFDAFSQHIPGGCDALPQSDSDVPSTGFFFCLLQRKSVAIIEIDGKKPKGLLKKTRGGNVNQNGSAIS